MAEEKKAAVDKLTVPIGQLTAHPKNPKRHNDEGIAKSIETNGYVEPIVVDENFQILSGHGRWEALKKLAYTNIDVIQKKGLTEKEKEKYIIVANRLVEQGGWDIEKLISGFKMDDLLDFGFDKFFLGGGQDPSKKTGVTEDNFDTEAVEKEITDPETKLGDVIILGSHRIMCGDSTKEEDVKKLLDGKTANMVFTSPPYNANTGLVYKAKDQTKKKWDHKKLYDKDSDNKDPIKYIEFCHAALKNIFDNCKGFIFWNVSYNANSRYQYIEVIYPYRDKLWETITWRKNAMPISDGLTRSFEFVFCFKNGGDSPHLGERFKVESNVWEISNYKAQDFANNHVACFPVGLPGKGIELGSDENEIILDPFGGTGTTLIACEQLGRKACLMELDPRYCDVIVKRWEALTKKKAVRPAAPAETPAE